MEEVAKLFYGIAGIFGILIAEFMRFGDMSFITQSDLHRLISGDMGVWIALFASSFGVFGFGMYPIALELSVLDHFHHIISQWHNHNHNLHL